MNQRFVKSDVKPLQNGAKSSPQDDLASIFLWGGEQFITNDTNFSS